MDASSFSEVMHSQFQICEDVLIEKSIDYATADRLHNFRVAAELQGCTPQKALAGMMAKHTVSLYDMCHSGQTYSYMKWDEKITDHINYLILLRAIVVEYEENHGEFVKETTQVYLADKDNGDA